MSYTRSTASSTVITTALNLSEQKVSAFNAPKKDLVVITNPTPQLISHAPKNPAFSWSFSSILKTAVFGYLALGAESAAVTSIGYGADICLLPSNNLINLLSKPQCPLEPSYNPCSSTHFLLQDSAKILDAKIIGIGERHSNRKATADCIEHLTKPGIKQTILFETYPHGMEIPCSSKQIQNKKERICIGWDTEKYIYEATLRYKQDSIKGVFLNVVQDGYYKTIPNIDALTKDLDNSLVVLKKEIENLIKTIINNKSISKQFDNLLDYMNIPLNSSPGSILGTSHTHQAIIQQIEILRKKKISYTSIANMKPDLLDLRPLLDHCNQGSVKACKKTYDLQVKRNKQLVTEIKKHADKGHQVIAVAGAAHFIPGMGMYAKVKEIQSSVEYVRKELEKGSEANPYAILALNEFEMISLDADERALAVRHIEPEPRRSSRP